MDGDGLTRACVETRLIASLPPRGEIPSHAKIPPRTEIISHEKIQPRTEFPKQKKSSIKIPESNR
jgi:hypothetical protein